MKKEYLNLGCGKRFNANWTNIDFVSSDENVISHNLLQGIPFNNGSFEVVYHSHILEHFTKQDGVNLINECYRVLKPGGILRVAVPDLEMIIQNYLKELQGAINGEQQSVHNYEWIMLELYDQVVRNKSGGDMARYIQEKYIPNEEYVFSRIGDEARQISIEYERSLKKKEESSYQPYKPSLFRFLKPSTYLNKLKRRKFQKVNQKAKEYFDIGKFRLGGEIHQWMYDRYSLNLLLKNAGFVDTKKQTAFESKIAEWNSFELESKNGIIYKPDSLFFEGVKP